MNFVLQDLSSALAILTAMITPAVLISACGTLILSTSTRLGRTVDRVRALLESLEELAFIVEDEPTLFEERREVIYKQLDFATRRNRLLQQAMVTFYLGLGMFIATSVFIGIVAVTGRGIEWLPAVLGLAGASFLFYGSILLIFEARLATTSLFLEMDFIRRLSKEFVSEKIIKDASRNRSSRLIKFPSVKRKSKPESDEEAY